MKKSSLAVAALLTTLSAAVIVPAAVCWPDPFDKTTNYQVVVVVKVAL